MSNEPPAATNQQPSETTDTDLFRELAIFIEDVTSLGLFPVASWGLDFSRPNQIALVTSTIPELPLALELIQRMHDEPPSPGRFIPIGKLRHIADRNSILHFRETLITQLDANNANHRRIITRLMNYCSAARWMKRAFVLVDIVGFSTMTTPAQLSCRMSLGLTIDQCIRRLSFLAKKELVIFKGFNRISTGDGFYVWNYDGSSEGHVALFVLLTYLMAQTEMMHNRDESPLRLKAAFAIGEAYTFPYEGQGYLPRDIQNSQFMPDAIGPALNLLRRLLEVAEPGQVLVGPFREPGREHRSNEVLDLPTMLTRVKAEILPGELKPTDSIKAHDIALDVNPSAPFRLSDKHGEVHYCFNVAGRVPSWTKRGFDLQNIGLIPDTALDVAVSEFKTQFESREKP